eukprot:5696925-Pyramimonas_sp.AAC.1
MPPLPQSAKASSCYPGGPGVACQNAGGAAPCVRGPQGPQAPACLLLRFLEEMVEIKRWCQGVAAI